MKRGRAISCFLLILLTAASAYSADTKYEVHAWSVYASLSGSNNECTVTSIEVFASNATARLKSQTGSTQTESRVDMSVDVWDGCVGMYVMEAFGSVLFDPNDLDVDKKLVEASFDADVEVFDEVSKRSLVVTVHFTWEPNGEEPFETSERSTVEVGDFKFTSRVNRTIVPARVEGSATFDGQRVDLQTFFGGEIWKTETRDMTKSR